MITSLREMLELPNFGHMTAKHYNLLLNLRINCISAKSALQILSIKDECTFLLLNFLRISLLLVHYQHMFFYLSR